VKVSKTNSDDEYSCPYGLELLLLPTADTQVSQSERDGG
jgi:hypothetical protein